MPKDELLQVQVPASTKRDIAVKAAKAREPLRVYVLRALAAYGVEVPPTAIIYFEAGFAHGLKIPVIFTYRADVFEELHFDTRQFNHIRWKEPEELKEKLTNRIAAVIGDGPFLN